MASKARLQTLKNRSEFLFLFKKGCRVRPASWLLLNFAINPEGKMRCGWTLPRQVGAAVTRNRLKRWSRDYFRSLLRSGEWAPVDINLVFHRSGKEVFAKLQYEEFSSILDKGWKQVKRRIS